MGNKFEARDKITRVCVGLAALLIPMTVLFASWPGPGGIAVTGALMANLKTESDNGASLRAARDAVAESWAANRTFDGIGPALDRLLVRQPEGRPGYVGPLGAPMTVEFHKDDPLVYSIVVDGLDHQACSAVRIRAFHDGAILVTNRSDTGRDRRTCLREAPNRLAIEFKAPAVGAPTTRTK